MTTGQKELPAGWKWVKLGDVCDVKGGKRLPKGTGFSEIRTDYPYIRVTDFRTGSIAVEEVRYISATVQSTIASYAISSEDLYISIAGTIGLVGRVPYELSGANLTENAAKIVIANINLDPDFLVYYLQSNSAQAAMAMRTNAVAQPKLALERIRTITIPLPPLEEQKRIAGILNKAEEIKKLREEADKKTEELIPAIFHEMVGSRIKKGKELPVGWKWVKLEELAAKEKFAYRIGPFGSALKKSELTPSGIPVCGIENVHPNKFIDNFRKFISEEKYTQLFNYNAQEEDLLVSTMGTIGRAALVPRGIGRMIYDSHLFRMRFDSLLVVPMFVSYAVNNFPGLKNEIIARSSGAIMSGLNTKILRTCSLPLPPLEEQQEIVDRLNGAQGIKKTNAESEKKIEELQSSLLQRAFRGEL